MNNQARETLKTMLPVHIYTTDKHIINPVINPLITEYGSVLHARQPSQNQG